MSLKLFFGVVMLTISLTVMILNGLIFMPVFRLAFVARKSTVYVIAFFNILSDLFQVLMLLHFSMCMIADRFLFSGERMSQLSIFLAVFYVSAWYTESFVQIMMAVNRFAIITLRKPKIFTFKTTMILFFFISITSVLCAVSNQYWFPCCKFVLDHELMTLLFVQVEDLYSYSNVMVFWYGATCTFVSTVCYTCIFVTIRRAPKVAPSNAQKSQDLRYLFQFVLISIFYISAWAFFEIFPFFAPEDIVEWYVVVPILAALNCSTNAIIYLSMNREVQKELKMSWCQGNGVAPITSISQAVHKFPSINNSTHNIQVLSP